MVEETGNSDKVGSSKAESERWKQLHYVDSSRGVEMDPTFVMKYKANSMKMSISKPNEVWYVDSSASNHTLSSNLAHRRRPFESCWPERTIEEHPACLDDHQEPSVSWSDR